MEARPANWKKGRIILWILVPVFMAGIVVSGLVIGFLSPPILSHLQKHAKADLKLASHLGLSACESHLSYLMDLRMEDDPEMVLALRNQSLEEIKRISRHFPGIHMMVVDGEGLLLDASRNLPTLSPSIPPFDRGQDEIHRHDFWDEPLRFHARYFPFWDWYIVSFIPEEHYQMPLQTARRIVYAGTFGVFLAVLLTLVWVFFRFVNRPINRLVTAVEGGKEGRFEQVPTHRNDEIGLLTRAFNEMMESLKKKESDLRETIDALRTSENRFRTAFETIPDAMGINRLEDGVFLDVNEGYQALSGYARGEVIGKSILEMDLWMDPEQRNAYARTLVHGGGRVKNLEVMVRRKDGSMITTLVSGALMTLDGRPHSLTSARDIQDLKDAEQALRESEERYRTLADHSLTGIYIHDFRGIFEYVNQRLSNMFGLSPLEMLGQKAWDVVHPAEQREVEGRVRRWSEGLSVEPRFVVRALNKDQNPIHLDIMTVKITHRGQPAIMGNVVDITSRVEAQKALEASEEKYRTILQSIEDGYFEVDLAGNLTFFNEAVCRLFGYSRTELMGLNNRDYTDQASARKIYRVFNEVYRTGVPTKGFDWELTGKDGKTRIVETSVGLMKNESGKPMGFRGVVRDISERKQMEVRLLEAQKMEAIGTLAGGIAHDFNNLLMGIQGNASLMLMDVSPDHPHRKRLKAIETQVKQGAHLTRQLLGFARGGKYEVRPINLNQVIRRSGGLFGPTHKEIQLQYRLQEDLWIVEADQGQMEQVLLNLFVNAWQAMPRGGTLTIQTENLGPSRFHAVSQGLKAGPYVRISVTDTGMGMDPEVRKRIFEPFFTTREVGKGTGLGLASAYGIIKNHGGIILAASEKGQGSTFSIYLPAVPSAEVEAEGQGTVPSSPIPKGNETILLVDDEEMVRIVGADMLKALGYRVVQAASGKEALDNVLIPETGGKKSLDLVILDMIMPGMGGRETFLQLRSLKPDLKVILSSGYSLDGMAKEILDQGCNAFIQKPFDLQELAKKVRDLLDA